MLSNAEERYVVRKFAMLEATTSTNGVKILQEVTNKNVSRSTVEKTLYKHGFKSYKRRKAPAISKKNLAARKSYYQKHKGKTYDYFKNHIFSDEASYHLMSVKGGLSYYKKIGAATKTNSFLRTKNLVEKVL